MSTHAITLDDVKSAHDRISHLIHRTPVLTCATLDLLSERTLFFKAETFQRSGSFKIRGASNAVFSMSAEQVANGVVTHSSGNHAGAVALAAKLRGVPAHIVVPHNTPKVKTDAVRSYGGTLYFCAPTIDAREEECMRIQQDTGAAFVHPYNDPKVMAGQGTIALELLDQAPHLDAIVVPISGGGMTSGIAVAAKALKPSIKIIAAEPRGINQDAADVAAAKAAGELVPSNRPTTIADGLQGRMGCNTWPIVRDLVDGVITVSEEEIVAAMRLIYMHAKVVVEPSGAVGLAAVLRGQEVHPASGSHVQQGGTVGIEVGEAESTSSVADYDTVPQNEQGKKNKGLMKKQGILSPQQVLEGCKAIGIILCGGNVDLDAKGFWDMENWKPS
ncbi:hypothetical protein CEUSTIGMA_g10027.t1 [Chlamydomonas eustigma]|uniref:Serine racemase n=1 Tax=Chlamydomonas eustigma TaxID=1157962 RepID=A0A250XHQ0_9CHLO|nr:hypothetical protein CEUSTIGMA_g10027.t1 [Chlamydomonas eustigma]|eukprot:GAX82601.1 hypothetical protein CEUSTIGMA_g10027.t1 [Chlamydomonas eustigma]